jgi:hypothetical protein
MSVLVGRHRGFQGRAGVQHVRGRPGRPVLVPDPGRVDDGEPRGRLEGNVITHGAGSDHREGLAVELVAGPVSVVSTEATAEFSPSETVTACRTGPVCFSTVCRVQAQVFPANARYSHAGELLSSR